MSNTSVEKKKSRLLADAMLLLQNDPELLNYLLSLPRKYNFTEIKKRVEHVCTDLDIEQDDSFIENEFFYILDDVGTQDESSLLS